METPPQKFASYKKPSSSVAKSLLHEINIRKAFAAMGEDRPPISVEAVDISSGRDSASKE